MSGVTQTVLYCGQGAPALPDCGYSLHRGLCQLHSFLFKIRSGHRIELTNKCMDNKKHIMYSPNLCCFCFVSNLCYKVKHCEAPCTVSQGQDGADRRCDTKQKQHTVRYMFLIAHGLRC